MEPSSTPHRLPILAVTLVSATECSDSASAAAALAGRTTQNTHWTLERPDTDSAAFAGELAAELARQADDGETGVTVLALDAAADPMEVGLVLEHLCERRHPADTRIGILDVVAVTSLAEVTHVLLGQPAAFTPTASEADVDAAEKLAGRIEFADLIVLTDADGRACEGEAVDLLRAMAPAAEILASCDLEQYRRRPARLTPHHAHRLASSLGWQRVLTGNSPLRVGDIGRVRSHLFRDPLPFHPGRLDEAITRDLVPARVGRILRSRGLVRLATRPDRVGSWSIAGDIVALDPTSMRSWDPDAPIGQELAFFGTDLDRDELTRVLDQCLLTSEELLAGPDTWATYPDPFPLWEDEHQH
ncbi:GTP-binding protein [Rathayibacter sp. VKM Ac-2754]|uniref:GTP-binding protein n=1 Tax=Rathayibacter sp. VKM Ac-2754 TaxID=2609251 RepID=UPI001359D819|nr:GTP-binding protein [Rathayibacter sp. VKM Ac-2754]MWV58822.1 cobalamin biosynthesis protein CobW [Rathayibacter sp. VKM Ac-2754]